MGLGLYIEDCVVGKTYKTNGRTIDQSDITLFAGLVGDFSTIHTDAEYAAKMPHGARIAHGPLTTSCAIGLFAQLGLVDGTVIALLNFNFDMKSVVKGGDTIHAIITIAEARVTSKKTSGVVKFAYDIRNQRGETVQLGSMTVLVKSRAFEESN
jgi:acyl dehydratase